MAAVVACVNPTKESEIKRRGKGRSKSVQALSSNLLGVCPSTIQRSLSSTRGLFKRGPWTIASTAVLATAAAQVMEGPTAAPFSGAMSAIDQIGGASSVLRHGARTGSPARNSEGRRLHAFESTEQCIDSPLWGKQVDPADYMFGCQEIEDMLQGNKTLVGNGQIRDVYVTAYRENTVVLKVLREQENPRKRNAVLQLHRREALALDAVRGHPNIVEMLGICNTTLVTQYHPTSLDMVMWRRRETLTIDRIVSMALDGAMGLQALHEASVASIVHFDMKPQQLLLVEDGRVMLNDFNMAQFMGTRGSGVSCPFVVAGRWRVVSWQAPEKIAGKPLTEKVDIYSMGMIFFSLMTGELPFPHGGSGRRKILEGGRPAIDPSWHTGYMQLVQGMWQQEPTDRPSARQVVARLEGILDSLRS